MQPLAILFRDSGVGLYKSEEEGFEEIKLMIIRSPQSIRCILRSGLEYREEAGLLAHMVGHVILGHLRSPYKILLELEPPYSTDPNASQQKREADYIKSLILNGPDRRLKIFDLLPNPVLRLAVRIAIGKS